MTAPRLTVRTSIRPVGVFVLAAVALLAAAGCFHGSDEGSRVKLDSLRNDSMASYQPPGARLVDSDEVNEHTAFGKPVAAQITRLFSLPERDPEGALDGTLDAAVEAGWELGDNPVIRLENAFGQIASRQLASGTARMTATVYPNGTPTGSVHGPALEIRLEHS